MQFRTMFSMTFIVLLLGCGGGSTSINGAGSVDPNSNTANPEVTTQTTGTETLDPPTSTDPDSDENAPNPDNQTNTGDNGAIDQTEGGSPPTNLLDGDQPATEPTTDVETDDEISGIPFSLQAIDPIVLVEGDPNGATIPVQLERMAGHSNPVSMTLTGENDIDQRLITIDSTAAQLSATQNSGSFNLRLAIDDLPIAESERTFFIDATDGDHSVRSELKVTIKPTDAPDIYLLAGQSNMVGFSGDGTKQSQPGGPDEPNPRIFQLNVTKNDPWVIFTNESAFTETSSNVLETSIIVQAEDPLHITKNDPANTSDKDLSYIGMGLSFAKKALQETSSTIVLVPAAWSGSSFCNNDFGPIGQWNALDTDNENLGNTWLFDRAVARANIAINETGGILRGILWHQGESDSNSRCADVYLSNLEQLARQLRINIDADQRGSELRRADANIPFVLGTMSRGIDEREDLSVFPLDKQTIDDAHRTLPSKIAHAAVTINDDITPQNGYPCGNTTCIHYGAAALRIIGERYYDALKRAVGNP